MPSRRERVKLKEKACKKNWYCQLHFESGEGSIIELTLFQDTISQVFELQRKNFNQKSVTKDDTEAVFMDLPSLLYISLTVKNL